MAKISEVLTSLLELSLNCKLKLLESNEITHDSFLKELDKTKESIYEKIDLYRDKILKVTKSTGEGKEITEKEISDEKEGGKKAKKKEKEGGSIGGEKSLKKEPSKSNLSHSLSKSTIAKSTSKSNLSKTPKKTDGSGKKGTSKSELNSNSTISKTPAPKKAENAKAPKELKKNSSSGELKASKSTSSFKKGGDPKKKSEKSVKFVEANKGTDTTAKKGKTKGTKKTTEKEKEPSPRKSVAQDLIDSIRKSLTIPIPQINTQASKEDEEEINAEDLKIGITESNYESQENIEKQLRGRHTRISILKDIPANMLTEENKSEENSKREQDSQRDSNVKLPSKLKRMINCTKLLVRNWAFQMETFFTKSEIHEIGKINKKFMSAVLVQKVNYFKKRVELLKEKVQQQKEKVPKTNAELPAFVMSKGVIKAVEILNENTHYKFYTDAIFPSSEEVILAYRVFFQFIKEDRLAKIKDNKIFWEETCKFFRLAPDQCVGSYVSNMTNKFDFSDDKIYYIGKILGADVQKMTPGHFSKHCGTTGFLIFLIKDMLEYSGLLVDRKVNNLRIYKNLIHEEYKDKIYADKISDFIDTLKVNDQH